MFFFSAPTRALKTQSQDQIAQAQRTSLQIPSAGQQDNNQHLLQCSGHEYNETTHNKIEHGEIFPEFERKSAHSKNNKNWMAHSQKKENLKAHSINEKNLMAHFKTKNDLKQKMNLTAHSID